MVQNRSSDGSSDSSGQIAAQLVGIVAKLDAIESQLRLEVAALKTVMFGTPLRYTNEGVSDNNPSDDEDKSDIGLGVQTEIKDLDPHNRSEEVPNSRFGHILLESYDKKPVTYSKDSQEVKLEAGNAMLKIFKDHEADTSVSDVFNYYDEREKDLHGKRSKEQDLNKNIPAALEFGLEMSQVHGPFTGFTLGRVRSNAPIAKLSSKEPATLMALPVIQTWDIDLKPHSVLTHQLIYEAGQPMIEWLIAWHNNQQISDLRLEDKSFYRPGCIDTNPRMGLTGSGRQTGLGQTQSVQLLLNGGKMDGGKTFRNLFRKWGITVPA